MVPEKVVRVQNEFEDLALRLRRLSGSSRPRETERKLRIRLAGGQSGSEGRDAQRHYLGGQGFHYLHRRSAKGLRSVRNRKKCPEPVGRRSGCHHLVSALSLESMPRRPETFCVGHTEGEFMMQTQQTVGQAWAVHPPNFISAPSLQTWLEVQ